ncbi:MAG: prepilin-type N-terminal cleavage/methylation domain-containing protein [Bacilli bacterium]|nr:prepilin-type N-terminal cleavage/methylation domain-containing protein [Bacilli bacterium]
MNRSLNRKGFTLVELLAVLVILVAIMGIAIPTISSSLERTKNKQNEARYKVIESAAELYVTDHKNVIYNNLGTNTTCYIQVGDLSDYLSNEEMEDSDGNSLSSKYVVFTKPNIYKYFNVATLSGSTLTYEEDGTTKTVTTACL